MRRSALPPTRTGPDQRRRRRALSWAGLLMGGASAALLGGLALRGPLSERAAAGPAGALALALLAALGAFLALRIPPAERALAGVGHLAGRIMSGAGLVLLADALALAQWDRTLFALGVALVGAWLTAGAAPPRDAPAQDPRAWRGEEERPARPRAPRRGLPGR